MRRSSPNEDQQTGGAPNTNRARRQPTSTGQGQESFRNDEHPEIPTVRRASLYLNAPPAPSVQTRAVGPTRSPRTERQPEEDWEQETRLPGQTRKSGMEHVRNSYPVEQEARLPRRPRRDPLDEDDYREQETRLSKRPRRDPLDEDDYPEQETRLPRRPRRDPLDDENYPEQGIRSTRRPRRDPLDDENYSEQEVRLSRRPRRELLDDDGYPEQVMRPVRRPRRELLDDEDYSEQENSPAARPRRPTPTTSNRVSVAQHPRPIVYEPKPADYHSPQGRPQRRLQHSQRALWAHVQDLRHNHVVLFAGGILIALIIIIPLLASFSQARLVTAIQMPGNETGTPGVSSQKGTGVVLDTEHPAPPVYATAAYLLDANTGATLYAHNASMHLPMMSTTKLMTGLLATQYGHLDQKITINNSIANDINQLSADSSVMGAKKGETYTLRDLLYGLMLPSGNDAAIVIADAISGSVPNFVALMNKRAQELGLHDTHYVNPHGLMDDGHYSSAHDLAVMGKVVMDVPSLHQITGTKEYHIAATKEHAEHFFSNSDQFMWWYPGVDGGKIGWDAGANFVQVISCTRNNHHLIGVTLHTIDWWTDMRDLMNWGFNSFTWLSPREINANVHPIPYAAAWNYFARDKRENSIPLANQGRYYVFTGYSVTQPIVSFFDKKGGLGKLGFPTSQPQTVNSSLQQRFEHGTVQCDQKSKQCKLV